MTNSSDIFASHPGILHPAQDGFIKGGDPNRCIDCVLDVWEHAHKKQAECYNIFYDIRAAYDSVRHDDMIRCLHRFGMPKSFIEFVTSSLSGLKAQVRTPYGCTKQFDVQRSLRQGDPLSPILFVMFVDSLHEGISSNPLEKDRNDGYIFKRWEGVKNKVIASKGFADDTWVVSGTRAGLRRINRWVHAWCTWHDLHLHPRKTRFLALEWKTNPDGGKGKYAAKLPTVPSDMKITVGGNRKPHWHWIVQSSTWGFIFRWI